MSISETRSRANLIAHFSIGDQKEKTTKKTEAAAESVFQEAGFLTTDHAWFLSMGVGGVLATATVAMGLPIALAAPFFLVSGTIFANKVIGDFGFITADSPEGQDLY